MNQRYLDNWRAAPLPVIPIEDERMNMFASHGIELFAVAGNALPGGSFKLPGIDYLIDAAREEGTFQKGDIVVEASSGRSALVLARRAKAEPNAASNVIAIMKADVPAAKRGAPQLAGAAEILLTPGTGKTPIQTAREMGGGGWLNDHWGKNGKYINLDQYACPHLKDGYLKWAVPKILDQVGEFDVLVTPVGTGGTAIGLSEGFKSRFPVAVVGALCATKDDEIPGMRDREYGMKEVSQPWEAALDYQIKVRRDPAFLCSPWLDWTADISGGPSGGAAFVAATLFLGNLIDRSELDRIDHGRKGKIKVLFVVHDDIMPYVADRYMTEFAMENFHPSTAKLPRQLIFG